MTSWFGHTQTVATISKSVTTVAGGIIGLESNLVRFLNKVEYYDKFFQRNATTLPSVLVENVQRLIMRCYEYRKEIHLELESSVAYVADAGRWFVGFDDWNTKMEKRMRQLLEFVVLANSLLVEYAIHGECVQDEKVLEDYVNVIADSIVLHSDMIPLNVPTVHNENIPVKEVHSEEDDASNPFNHVKPSSGYEHMNSAVVEPDVIQELKSSSSQEDDASERNNPFYTVDIEEEQEDSRILLQVATCMEHMIELIDH